ncbi:MAG: methylglyoxal synthase [Oceanicaulis sp.]|nr:methylglyoxal synthase [Oceanicaulis sp.]
MKSLGLVAHDACKPVLLSWVGDQLSWLGDKDLYATGTTGAQLNAAYPALQVTALKSGPLGGDQQLGAMIAEGRLDALIFFTDPMSPQPHDVDVKALTRLAVLYDIPLALNRASAMALLSARA